jgi:hypothetical protein
MIGHREGRGNRICRTERGNNLRLRSVNDGLTRRQEPRVGELKGQDKQPVQLYPSNIEFFKSRSVHPAVDPLKKPVLESQGKNPYRIVAFETTKRYADSRFTRGRLR